MKKGLSLLLALALTVNLAGCGSSTSSSNSNQLIIGSTTDVNADFMSGWTNIAVNSYIKTLMSGYETISYTKEGTFVPNMTTLAQDIETTENSDGTKTFTMTINEGLVYNDGSAITAEDYVFSALLAASPEFGSLDASNFSGSHLVGFEDFNSGESRTFSGIRLIDDYTFSFTVKAEELPYYYDIYYASAEPSSIATLAPGVTVYDEGNGVTISEEFTSELLQETILDPETGARYNPTVTSGPYQFVSYDSSTYQAVIEINPNFVGNYEGQTPSIQTLIFKSVVNATQFDELAAGSVDLIQGVSGGDSINTGLDLVDNGSVDYFSYPRNGYGKITFACNFGPTEDPLVRQAISYTLDREEFAKVYTGGFGQLTHGYYSYSSWEYQDNADAINDEFEIYTKDLEKAEALLIEAGWTLNANGDDYVKGTDTLRYKKVDGVLTPLEIEWANTPDNPVSDLIALMLPDAMAEVGMKLNPTTIEFAVLLENMQQTGGQQNYHMYNSSLGFATLPSPWYYFNSDLETYGGAYNPWFIADETLNDIVNEMKYLEAGDSESWSKLWLAMQIRINELCIELPLYSDEYHDFFSSKLEGYEPSSIWSLGYSLVYASIK